MFNFLEIISNQIEKKTLKNTGEVQMNPLIIVYSLFVEI